MAGRPKNISFKKRYPMSQTIETIAAEDLDNQCRGSVALTARREPWMNDILSSPQLPELVKDHGSPLNLIATEPVQRNVRELETVARSRSIDLRVFFARKANKCLSLVDAASTVGAGIDVASENELSQVLNRGIPGSDIICTAAVKSESLIRKCIDSDVTIAVDNQDELALIHQAAANRVSVAIRLSGFDHDGEKLPSRFGVDVDRFRLFVDQVDEQKVNITGLHFHLDGYCSRQRISAINQSLSFVDELRQLGHTVDFLDIGGGIPMSYLDDANAWQQFWRDHEAALLHERKPITYRNHALGRTVAGDSVVGSPNCYPYWQSPTRADWLAEVLDHEFEGRSIADRIRASHLQLRCEPGRSILDGCGMTVAQVEFRKQSANGEWLIGLSMNRTQCRTGSDDFLVDPILIPCGAADKEPTAISGYLVGAYCTESELITLRRLHFPSGVHRGDLVAFPNTAGYLMHFLESRSHQFPLAKNLVHHSVSGEHWELDPIDS